MQAIVIQCHGCGQACPAVSLPAFALKTLAGDRAFSIVPAVCSKRKELVFTKLESK